MEHKWKYEIYVNGEWNSEYRLTAEEIKEVEKFIKKISKGC